VVRFLGIYKFNNSPNAMYVDRVIYIYIYIYIYTLFETVLEY